MCVSERGKKNGNGQCLHAYIRPCDEIVGSLAETHDQRMLHHLVRKIKVVRVFDQRPTRFTPARIASKFDVRLKIGDLTRRAILGLPGNSVEEK